MSAKDNYYKYLEDMKEIHKEGFRDVITDYVDELETEIKRLTESTKQKQIIRLCNRLDKIEQLIKDIDADCNQKNNYPAWYYRLDEVLK